MNATQTEDLTSLICQKTMHIVAQLCIRGDKEQVDHKLLSQCLKEAVKAGHAQLLADLKEANEAFFGNDAMLQTVLNVGCAELATKAWTKYREQRI